MNLIHVSISNFRALRSVSLSLTPFACLIGQNNAGKSTLLKALHAFFEGTRRTRDDYYDPTLPIRIAVTFANITQKDIDRLAPLHRDRISEILTPPTLTLIRHFDTAGSGKLMYQTLVPIDPRFRRTNIDAIVTGRGAALRASVVESFPELNSSLPSSPTQTAIRESIRSLADEIPDDAKELADADLPTGIDASIKAFLPNSIYIAAVKDLGDDVRTAHTTPFGKLLSLLLEAIAPQLADATTLFAELSRQLNRTTNDDGDIVDSRLSEIRTIETTLQSLLRETFSSVSLELTIPPPELKTILSTAQLLVDDGIRSDIETKGDGLRRAAVFSILRAYVMLHSTNGMQDGYTPDISSRHVLLFEEPELYLHPSAQHILFDVLATFSQTNHVFISTHSPAFLRPNGTASFVKITKTESEVQGAAPYSTVLHVDVTDIADKDQFQLITYENNNAAFFYESIILVEGDSDFIVLPHIAQLLCQNAKDIGASHKLVRINGKGSIKRYKQFFSRFGVRIAVVTDLDLLVNGFAKIDPDHELLERHSALMALVNGALSSESAPAEASGGQVREARKSGENAGRWRAAKEAHKAFMGKSIPFEDLAAKVDEFFAWESEGAQLRILRGPEDEAIQRAKQELLALLRKRDVYVLSKGDIEDYYPPEVSGHDKPSMAQDFCKRVSDAQMIRELCEKIDDGGTEKSELDVICAGLFGR